MWTTVAKVAGIVVATILVDVIGNLITDKIRTRKSKSTAETHAQPA